MRAASLIGFWVSSLAALAGFFMPWFVTTETTTTTLSWGGTQSTSSGVLVREQSGFQRMAMQRGPVASVTPSGRTPQQDHDPEYFSTSAPAPALILAAMLVVMASMSSLVLSIVSTAGSAPFLGHNLRSLARSGFRWVVSPLTLGAVVTFWIECLCFFLFATQRLQMAIAFMGQDVTTQCSLTPWFWVTALSMFVWFGCAAAYGFIPDRRAGSLRPVKRRTRSDDAR